MKVKVISFAGFRHVLGKEMQIELGEEARDMTVLDLLEALCTSRAALRPLLFSGEDLREDVNVFVAGKNISNLRGIQTLLAEGDEVALFPAAIGG
jgi:molybdopterin synthase sulfur carrier subunit